jgi:hypothetical protein
VRDVEGASEALDGLRAYAVVAAHTIRQRAEVEDMAERVRAALRDAAPASDGERLTDEELYALRQAANAQFWREHDAVQGDFRRVQRGEFAQLAPTYVKEHEALTRALDKIDAARTRRAALLRADAGRQRGSE